MRRLGVIIAASLGTLGGPVSAADSVAVQVRASRAEACLITSPNAAVTLSAVDAQQAVLFSYRCNFIGSPTLTFQSQFGGIRGDANGNPILTYAVYLNDSAPTVPPSLWLQSSSAQSPVGYGPAGTNPAITTTISPNVDRSPQFRLALRQPMTIAGSYSDTLTVSIAP